MGFGLIGGVVVDRWDKRKVLIAVQALSGLVALAVSILIFADRLELWHLAVSAVLQGVLMAVRLPSGNSLIYLMVGRKVILNALASQLIALNLSRIVGSVVAGDIHREPRRAIRLPIHGIQRLAGRPDGGHGERGLQVAGRRGAVLAVSRGKG